MPARVDRQGFGRIAQVYKTIENAERSSELGTSFLFLVTSDQHGQEQDKYQDAEQDFEGLPDVYRGRRRVVINLLRLFHAM